VKETQGALYRETAEQIRELGAEADDDDDEAAAKKKILVKVLAHLLKWEDARSISRSLELARSEPSIPVLPADLDGDPWALNVQNGTIDLKTGRLRPHRQEELLTKLARVAFDPAATCPVWQQSLDRWMGGNTGLVSYLQRVVGYCLTGDVSEQSLWFLYGLGANGKSTFLMALLALLADYGMQAVSDLLMAKHNESHPTERADLFGKRFVATIEAEEGKRMAEALMKQLTGADKVRARRMRQDFFEFTPTHKILLAANHKPTVRGTDYAVWRRIKLIPFTVTIPEAQKDKRLPDKLQAEGPGILAWAVRGCLDWQREGLAEPEEVRKATAAYQAEQDIVQSFLDECCILQSDAKEKSSAVLAAYHTFSGDKAMTPQAFRKRLNEKGFESKEGTGGCWFWRGFGLRKTDPTADNRGSS
jgi:putative DNA primase/helicase